MIEVVKRFEHPEVVAAWIRGLTPWLRGDVSTYAKGRLRCWLRTEPPLGPTQSFRPGVPVDDPTWNRLADIIGWKFDYALATYSGLYVPVGITAHRDASYADYEAYGLNVTGTCEFRYWNGRECFGKGPEKTHFLPNRDAPTHVLQFQPGDVVRFNCKNLHEARPGPDRWSLQFWRKKPGVST